MFNILKNYLMFSYYLFFCCVYVLTSALFLVVFSYARFFCTTKGLLNSFAPRETYSVLGPKQTWANDLGQVGPKCIMSTQSNFIDVPVKRYICVVDIILLLLLVCGNVFSITNLLHVFVAYLLRFVDLQGG